MFRVYVKLCHGVTVIRSRTGSGLQAKQKQATPHVQTAALPYASMALSRMRMATYIARYATIPRAEANGRVDLPRVSHLTYHVM